MEGRVAPPLHASAGVIAGCALATTFVKVCCIGPFDGLSFRHPRVSIDAYIDDFTLLSEGNQSEVKEDLVKAAFDLQDVIENELRGRISIGKSAVVASHSQHADGIRICLGRCGEARAH